MSTFEKDKDRLKSIPKDFTYDEVKSILQHMDFIECNKGSTSGSKVMFFRQKDNIKVMLHKPHPGNIVCVAFVKYLKKFLEEIGEL